MPPAAPRPAPQPAPPFTLPPCDRPGCGRLATFGFGAFLLRGIRGQWFCGQHRPAEEIERDRARLVEAVARREAEEATLSQGDLF